MGKLLNSEIKSPKKQKMVIKDGKIEKSKKVESATDIIKEQLCNETKKSNNQKTNQAKRQCLPVENLQRKNDKEDDAKAEQMAQNNLNAIMDEIVDLDNGTLNKNKNKSANQQLNKQQSGGNTENQKEKTSPQKAKSNVPKLQKQNTNEKAAVKNTQPKGGKQKAKKTATDSAGKGLTDGVIKSKENMKQMNQKNLNKANKKAIAKSQPPNAVVKPVKEKTEANNDKSTNSSEEAPKIFVGNLPININKKKLARLFQEFKPINSIAIRTDLGKRCFSSKQRKQSTSLIAYITFKDKKTAEEALSINGTEFSGRHLRVTLGNKSALKITSDNVKKTVFVGNLKYTANDESLRSIFSSCGDIDYVRCINNTKGCIGVAYVRFKSADAVTLALELNGTMVDDRPIRVERYNPKKIKEAEEKHSAANSQLKEQSDTAKSSETELKINGSQPNSKKEKFKGVATKPMKHKTKKPNNKMTQLAKKIAPTSKANV